MCMSPRYFHQLRTEQQLGYLVGHRLCPYQYATRFSVLYSIAKLSGGKALSGNRRLLP
ncbi:hypothetical protein [Alishewanella longhuensis]